jgi:hypothetical protein
VEGDEGRDGGFLEDEHDEDSHKPANELRGEVDGEHGELIFVLLFEDVGDGDHGVEIAPAVVGADDNAVEEPNIDVHVLPF